MKVYFGGCEYPKALTQLHDLDIKAIMFSYAAKPSAHVWQMAKDYSMDILLDSGAFSAWSRGKRISVQEYADYLTKWQPQKYFNLDVIGDSEGTARNQTYLESLGFLPIPVFHFGEPMTLLDELVRNYKVIGLGGTVGKPHTQRRAWLGKVYSLHPSVKFHGLGITNRTLLEAYPFYSVDSTWWLAKFKTKSPRVSMDQEIEREHRIKALLTMAGSGTLQYQVSLF
ncbi:MAG TPA: hypothetical protein VFC58_13760 [Desulfosporosinus sp.]|nr:hypothetical protein [Desulfosporosinus sp.]